MITLSAPYPAPNVVSILPNPLLSDVSNRNRFIDLKRTMDNTQYSYVRDEATYRLTFTLSLTTAKSLELRAFITEFFGDPIRLEDHTGQNWLVNVDGNPFEVAQQGRNVENLTITFEGVKL